MAPSLLLASSCLLLASVATAKVCNDYTGRGVDAAWSSKDVPIMVLMPMNESALMSSISQGIEPAVQLAIRHIRESGHYSFSLITKIYDTEVRAWLVPLIFMYMCYVCLVVWGWGVMFGG